LILLKERYLLIDLIVGQIYIWNIIILISICFIRILTKINRSPIDLVEREVELVLGFNVEYYGIELFVLLFCIAEYGIIIFFLM